MLRFVIRMTVVGLALAGTAYALGYRWDDATERRVRVAGAGAGAAAGALAGKIDRERVREAGTGIAETIADGADRAGAALAEGRLTAKIKAKMTLDDTLDARRLDVDTEGTVVTLRGSVATSAERQRALQLARETDGVTSVVNRITVNER